MPWEALEDWMVAELLVNGGEYRTVVREKCMNCAGLGVRTR